MHFPATARIHYTGVNIIMKSKKYLFLVCIAIPLLTGLAASLLTGNEMYTFRSLNQPPLSPPAWLFPVVWTILYLLMGISSYLILISGADENTVASALTIYFLQLAVNFLWPTFFFNFGWYLFSFFWLVLLWILVFIMILRFFPISKWAAWLNIPYLVWLTFAGYLNFGIWWLNR